MDVKLAEASRAIDPQLLGKRIRNARIAAELTQVELAADEITPAHVSRIESGQRRPEFGLLTRLAGRLGVHLTDLLEQPQSAQRLEWALGIDHAELSLVGGSPADALDAAERLLSDIDGDEADLIRRARMVRAGALEATGDLNGAIAELESLVAAPTPHQDWLRCLIALSRCHREVGDLNRSIAVGHDAERLIEELGLTGSTEAIQLTVTVAAAHMFRGEHDLALRMCTRAIEQSEANQDMLARASAYWNASLVHSRNGANDTALDLARSALSAFEAADDARNLSRLRGHVADLLLALDPPDTTGALEAVEQALCELAWAPASLIDRASHLQTRARAHSILGRSEEARADLERSLEIIPPDACLERAYAHALVGEIEMTAGRPDTARSSFHEAVRLLTGIGADRDAAQLWSDLGGWLRDLGDAEAALDAFERAAAATGLRTQRPTASADSLLRD